MKIDLSGWLKQRGIKWAWFGAQLGAINAAIATVVIAVGGTIGIAFFMSLLNEFLNKMYGITLTELGTRVGIGFLGLSLVGLITTVAVILLVTSIGYWFLLGCLRDNVTGKFTRRYGEIFDLVLTTVIFAVLLDIISFFMNPTTLEVVGIIIGLIGGAILGYITFWFALRIVFPIFRWKSPVA